MNTKKTTPHLSHSKFRIVITGVTLLLLLVQVIFASGLFFPSSEVEIFNTRTDSLQISSSEKNYGHEFLGGVDGYYSAGSDFAMDNNDYAYAISSIGGLNIYKFNRSSDKFNVVSRLDDDLGGFKIILKGSVAYTVSEYGVTVFNVTDPASPRKTGFYVHDDSKYTMIAIKDDILYVLTREHLWLYDTSSPSILSLVNVLEISGCDSMIDMAVSGNHLFIIDYDEGIYILDISNSLSPQVIGHVFLESPKRIYAYNDLVYVGSYDPLHIYHFENNNLTLIATLNDIYNFNDAVQVGNYVHFVSGSSYIIVDVSDLSNISVKMKHSTASSLFYALLVFDSEKKTVISKGKDGFLVMDYSDFSSPREIATSTIPARTVIGTVVINDLLFVATEENGVFVYDFTDPKNPSLNWSYEDTNTRYSINNYTNYVFVSGVQGVEVFYVSNSRTVEYKGIIPIYATRSYYDPETSKIFIASGGKLSIYQITLNPFSTHWIQDVSIGGVYSVKEGVPRGDYLFIAGRNYGFYALKYNTSSKNYNVVAEYKDSSAEFTRVFAPSWTEEIIAVNERGALIAFTLTSNSSGTFLVKSGEYSGGTISGAYLYEKTMYLVDSSDIVLLNITSPKSMVKTYSFHDYELLQNPKEVFYYNHMTIVTCRLKVVPVRIYYGSGPQPPTNPSITTINGKIKLSWDASDSGDAPIQYYKIYREITEESNGAMLHSFTYLSKVSRDSHEFMDSIEINKSLIYNYYIVAVNSISESQPSNTVTLQGSAITTTTTYTSTSTSSTTTTSTTTSPSNTTTTSISSTTEEEGLNFNLSAGILALAFSILSLKYVFKKKKH